MLGSTSLGELALDWFGEFKIREEKIIVKGKGE
jgi:hypothetical protein